MQTGNCRLWHLSIPEMLLKRCSTEEKDRGDKELGWNGENEEIERKMGIHWKTNSQVGQKDIMIKAKK